MRRIGRAALVLAVIATGCEQSNTGADGPAGDLGPSELGANVEGGAPDLGESDLTFSCGTQGQVCTGASCCAPLFCDTGSNTCKSVSCKAQGEACASPSECCGQTCTGGVCGGLCRTIGDSCSSNGDCCSANCTNGSCQPVTVTVDGGTTITPTCTTTGNTCMNNSECCSLNCLGGRCIAAWSCQALGDICYQSTECCSGYCNVGLGQSAGLCTELPQVASGGCTKDGEPCADCGKCCTRTCITTPSGGHACAPASGCKVAGDLCTKDSDCCGAAGSGVAGDGNTTCEKVSGQTVGTCRLPMSCNPVGNVCGIKLVPYLCGTNSNAREDCCSCDSPKWNCCKLDQGGIPRCFGGGSQQCPNGYDANDPNCCIATGDRCLFSGQCCNNHPCVPDDQGVLRCGAACVQPGGVCTANSDCCTGLLCIIPNGATTGKCGNPPPPPDLGAPPDLAVPPGSDLAVPPGADLYVAPVDMAVPPNADLAAPVCAQYAQACSATGIPCCPGQNLTCYSDTTGQVCTANDARCSCFFIP